MLKSKIIKIDNIKKKLKLIAKKEYPKINKWILETLEYDDGDFQISLQHGFCDLRCAIHISYFKGKYITQLLDFKENKTKFFKEIKNLKDVRRLK